MFFRIVELFTGFMRAINSLFFMVDRDFFYRSFVPIRKAIANTAIELPPKGGFNFDLCRRNEMIANKLLGCYLKIM